MIQTMTTNLMVTDINESIAFYQEALEFKVMDIVENVFAILGDGTVTLMLEERKALIEEYPSLNTETIKPTITLFTKVDDIHAYHQRIAQKFSILKAMNETFYGTLEFAIADPDGYVITFAGEK